MMHFYFIPALKLFLLFKQKLYIEINQLQNIIKMKNKENIKCIIPGVHYSFTLKILEFNTNSHQLLKSVIKADSEVNLSVIL